MKIVRDLDTAISPEEVQEIYNKGNKIAIVFNVDTWIVCSDSIGVLTKEGRQVGLPNKDVVCIEGLKMDSCHGIIIEANTLVVVDGVEFNEEEKLGYIKPFKAPHDEWNFSFQLYSCGEIAHKVVEVSFDEEDTSIVKGFIRNDYQLLKEAKYHLNLAIELLNGIKEL